MSDMLKLSNARLILVREMADGPKTHGALRIAYFGIERAKGNTANTSFYNKLKDAKTEGLVKQDVEKGPYSLDVKGLEILAHVKKEKGDAWMTFLSAIKSEAQLLWESQHA